VLSGPDVFDVESQERGGRERRFGKLEEKPSPVETLAGTGTR
jgi:hypothetical protein